MANYNMLFAGFGGQGILFAGKVMAYAGLIDDKEVSWLPSYGPEMRGGTANCSVVISDEPVGSPLVTTPDVLVAMNGPSLDKFLETVPPGGKVFIDSSLIQWDCGSDNEEGNKKEIKESNQNNKGNNDFTVYCVPASRLSKEENLEGMANMILLGKVLAETGIATLETVEKALQECVPVGKSHLLHENIRAIKLGIKQ